MKTQVRQLFILLTVGTALIVLFSVGVGICSIYTVSITERAAVPQVMLHETSPDKSWSVKIVKVCHVDPTIWCEVYDHRGLVLLRSRVKCGYFDYCDEVDRYFNKLLVDNERAQFGQFSDNEFSLSWTIVKKDVVELLK